MHDSLFTLAYYEFRTLNHILGMRYNVMQLSRLVSYTTTSMWDTRRQIMEYWTDLMSYSSIKFYLKHNCLHLYFHWLIMFDTEV